MHYKIEQLDPKIFRAYDIRGIVGTQISANTFYTIGRAISLSLKRLERSDIFLARDGRLSSDVLATALRQGLLDSGINIFDIGEVATPVLYYATNTGKTDCGLMITGSHNPADYNGIKIVLGGKTLVASDIQQLYNDVLIQTFPSGSGKISNINILPEYKNRIINDIKLSRSLKVVVDCGNGVAGPVIPELIKALGCDVTALYSEIDGNFPNHHPDPSVIENLQDLQEAVLAQKADIGLAFDGDADRLGVITNTGEIIWPDRLMMLYAKELLKTNPDSTIVFDVKCSNNLANVIQTAGGIAKMCPTGHSIIKACMKQENAILAGEMSGHIFFKDRWYGFDDALYSACRLLEILSSNQESISRQFQEIPDSVNTPEIKIPIQDEKKFNFMRDFLNNASFPHSKMIKLDGLRVEFDNGWGLIRASNTTPCLVARFEANDAESLTQIQKLFRLQLTNIDTELKIPF